MSHVVNPILFRLKYSSFWTSVCVTNKKFLFFLDSKNVFVIDYLSKIISKMYFIYTKYNIAFFKISYRSKAINIYFMLKQIRGLSFLGKSLLKVYSKKRIKKLSCLIMFDIFRSFKHDPSKLKTFEMRKFASNWFEYFNDDLYYDIKWFLRLKITEKLNNVNLKIFKDYKLRVSTKNEKIRRSKLVRFALLCKRRHYILNRVYLGIKKSIVLEDQFFSDHFNSVLTHYLPRFYNTFNTKLYASKFKNNLTSNFKSFMEKLNINKYANTKIIDNILIKHKIFSSYFSWKKRFLEFKKKFKKRAKKKKRVFFRKEFVMSTTNNLSFMLNRRRRRKYKLVFYGWKLWSRFNIFHKKSKLALDLKNSCENFRRYGFNILNAKETEVRKYKIWRLSNNYMKDIKMMYSDLRVLVNRNQNRANLLYAGKLKKSKIRKAVFRKRNILHRLARAFARFRSFPVNSRIRYAFKKRKSFKKKFNRKYFKDLKKKASYHKVAHHFEMENRLKTFEDSKQRFKKGFESFFKNHNKDWFILYDQCFLLQRKKWERNFKMGFKFYNTFDYKLPLQYLTFPYMEFYYHWLLLFNQFLYERQRRLFPSKSPFYYKRKRVERENRKLKALWEDEKNKNLWIIKDNKKFLIYINFSGFLSQKLRSRRYWRKKKTIYKYLKRWKKYTKLKKKMRHMIKLKKHKVFKRFIYWLKQVHFLMAYSVYAFILKNKISSDLNLIFSFKANFNIYFFIKKPAKKTRINAITVFNYIKKRIFRGASLFRLLKYVMRKFKKFYYLKLIDGFAIKLSGRFSKRDRAAQYWFKHGKFTKSTRISKIDHYAGKMFLKYSTCSLKVSIMRNNYRHKLKKKKEKLKKIKKVKKLSVI